MQPLESESCDRALRFGCACVDDVGEKRQHVLPILLPSGGWEKARTHEFLASVSFLAGVVESDPSQGCSPEHADVANARSLCHHQLVQLSARHRRLGVQQRGVQVRKDAILQAPQRRHQPQGHCSQRPRRRQCLQRAQHGRHAHLIKRGKFGTLVVQFHVEMQPYKSRHLPLR